MNMILGASFLARENTAWTNLSVSPRKETVLETEHGLGYIRSPIYLSIIPLLLTLINVAPASFAIAFAVIVLP